VARTPLGRLSPESIPESLALSLSTLWEVSIGEGVLWKNLETVALPSQIASGSHDPSSLIEVGKRSRGRTTL